MFNKLRLRLTAVYMLTMLAFMALVVGVMYALTNHYLGFITDQALRQKMAQEYKALNVALPQDLIDADKKETDEVLLDEAFDDDLASIFTLPLDGQAQRILNASASNNLELRELTLPDHAATQAARENGSDLRTLTAGNGVRVRLLTHYFSLNVPTAYLQMGSVLADEDYILRQLLMALLPAGAIFIILSGGVSWWLAGRSLRPTQQAWERQQTFVANASHELRTPLTLIRASAEVAQRSLASDHSQRRLLDMVLSESDHMSNLVDDLLLLSRLDASQSTLDRRTIQLSELLANVQQSIASLAHERGLSVRIETVQGAVFADPTRLRQVLLILLDNSLRHTPRGGFVTLDTQLRDQVVQISVCDTGEGIASEHLPHVFERFYQADSSRANRGSAGLGLSIARSLVEVHGGKITIDSEVGNGTRVTIALPVVVVPQIVEQEAELSSTLVHS